MAFRILFRGQLKAGVSREETIALLAKISRLSAEQAEQRFFSGDAVRIKSFEDRFAAEEFVNKLFSAGIVAELEAPSPVTDAASVEPASEVPAAPPVSFSSKPAPQMKPGKVVVWSGIALGLLLAVGGAALWYVNGLFDTSVPAIVNRAENALLNNQAALLGHANVEQISKLERTVLGTREDDERPDPAAEGLLNQLLLSDINVRRDFQQLVFSFNVDANHGPYLSAVVASRADPKRIRQFLKDNYEVSAEQRGEFEVLTFRKQDRDLCRYSEPLALILGEGTIVLSHPEKVVSIHQDLLAADSDAAVNQEWVAYRSKRLLSVGVLEPDQLEGSPIPGVSGLLLMGLRNQWESMESIFIGAKGNLVPPALSVDLTVNSADEEWVRQSKASLREMLDESGGDTGFMSVLFAKIGVEGDRRSIATTFTVDQALIDSGKTAFKEGIAGLFSTVGDGTSDDRAEQIDEDPQIYLERFAVADFPEFENFYGKTYQWTEGPLAARLQSVEINRDGLTTVEVEVAVQDLPNAPGSQFGDRGSLQVLDVTDANGNSLLQEETCGTDLNQDPASFAFNKTATKRVRLKRGSSLADVASIKARVSLRLATETASERLGLPLAQDTFEQGSSYLRIQEVKGGDLGYVLRGSRGGFLNLRALNAKQQYLSSAGSSSFADSISLRFQGEIASLELTRAIKVVERQYDFTLDTTEPAQSDGGFFSSEATVPTPYDSDDWSNVLALSEQQTYEIESGSWWGEPVAVTRAGPAQIALFQPEVSRFMSGPKLRGQLQISLPYVQALEDKSNRAELRIDELQFDSGAAQASRSDIAMTMAARGFGNNYKDSSKSEAELRNDLYLNAQPALSVSLSDQQSDDAALRFLSGELLFHLPTEISSHTLDPLQLGSTVETETFSLKIVEIASEELGVSVTGSYSDLLDLQVLDAEGKLLGSGIDFSEESSRNGTKPNYGGEDDPPLRTLGKLRFNGPPSKLVVLTAGESSTERYPFALEVGSP